MYLHPLVDKHTAGRMPADTTKKVTRAGEDPGAGKSGSIQVRV